jgi:hypothetical protein
LRETREEHDQGDEAIHLVLDEVLTTTRAVVTRRG